MVSDPARTPTTEGAFETLLAVAERHPERSEDARIKECVKILRAELAKAQAMECNCRV